MKKRTKRPSLANKRLKEITDLLYQNGVLEHRLKAAQQELTRGEFAVKLAKERTMQIEAAVKLAHAIGQSSCALAESHKAGFMTVSALITGNSPF